MGTWRVLLTVVGLLPALAGALMIVLPAAFGLGLVVPVWGTAIPFVAWVMASILLSRPILLARGLREPTNAELRRLKEPVLGALRRVGISPGRIQLMVVESEELNAPATTGRIVVVTSYAMNATPPVQLEAVVAHELGHHVGLNAVPVFCHAQLMLPSRALWWLLTSIWRPVRRVWRVAVAWRTLSGFLATFLLAIAVAVVFAVSAVPACLAVVGASLSRFSTDRAEFHADALVLGLGLGPQLLASLDAAIEANGATIDLTGRLIGLLPLSVRRAHRLRGMLVR